jgi:hypothetical protein
MFFPAIRSFNCQNFRISLKNNRFFAFRAHFNNSLKDLPHSMNTLFIRRVC